MCAGNGQQPGGGMFNKSAVSPGGYGGPEGGGGTGFGQSANYTGGNHGNGYMGTEQGYGGPRVGTVGSQSGMFNKSAGGAPGGGFGQSMGYAGGNHYNGPGGTEMGYNGARQGSVGYMQPGGAAVPPPGAAPAVAPKSFGGGLGGGGGLGLMAGDPPQAFGGDPPQAFGAPPSSLPQLTRPTPPPGVPDTGAALSAMYQTMPKGDPRKAQLGQQFAQYQNQMADFNAQQNGQPSDAAKISQIQNLYKTDPRAAFDFYQAGPNQAWSQRNQNQIASSLFGNGPGADAQNKDFLSKYFYR